MISEPYGLCDAAQAKWNETQYTLPFILYLFYVLPPS